MKLEHAVVEQVVPGKFRGNKADSQIVGDGRGDQIVGRNFDARVQIQPLFLKEIVPKKPRRRAGLHADKRVHTELFKGECAVLQLGKTVSGDDDVLELGNRHHVNQIQLLHDLVDRRNDDGKVIFPGL